MELRAMKKLCTVAFLSLLGLGLGGGKASAWWYLQDWCCGKHCPKIKCYQYNAFSPYCCYIPPGVCANRVLPNAPDGCCEDYPCTSHSLWNRAGCGGGYVVGSMPGPGDTIVSVTPGPTTPAAPAPAAGANSPAPAKPAPTTLAPVQQPPTTGNIRQGGPAYGQLPPGYGQQPAYPTFQGGYPQNPPYGGYPQYPQYNGAAPGYWGNNGFTGSR
jgi:hypothetical protein